MITLRLAKPSDWARLYAWRNDPDTVSGSATSKAVDLSDHLVWLAAVLAKDDTALYVAVDQGRSRSVGTVRLDVGDDEVVLSITVDPRARGEGYAPVLISHAVEEARARGVPRAVADVRVANVASLRAFASAGFSVRSITGGMATLELVL